MTSQGTEENSPKAHYSICSSIITAIVLCLAQLPNTDRRQANVAATSEAEKEGIND